MFLQKDVKNLVSKHIFTRWQALLSCFDFEITQHKGRKKCSARFSYKKVFAGIKMSVRPSTKDQYGPPLGSQNVGSKRLSMMPPIASNVQ